MPDESSAGVVLFRKTPQGVKFLLLHYDTNAKHWDFPKGHIEEGENPHQTAQREVEEETGISDLTFLDGFEKKVTYFYMRGQKRVHKEVLYFLAETSEENVTISHEHLGYAWLSYDEALEKITFKNSKDVLMAANEFLG